MKVQEARDALLAAFRHVDPPTDAERTTDAIVDAALRKDDRMSPIREAAVDLEKFRDRGNPVAHQRGGAGAVDLFDLNGAPGLCYFTPIVDRVRDLTNEYGVGVVGIRNTGGIHSLSPWVNALGEEGYPALFLWNGGSYTTVPYGSTEPFFGTNPLAYAIPTDDRAIVADFSTSQIPFMNFWKAYQSKSPIPQGAGMNKEGDDSIDPADVFDEDGDGFVRLRPMGGGPKGSALMLLIEVLTGAMVGGRMGRRGTDDPFTPEEFGGTILAFNPSFFGTDKNFTSEVTELTDGIRGSTPARGVSSVELPGDGEYAREQSRRAEDEISLDADTIQRLKALSE
jgi:LDH2 family malate/lactate/ureidoglycolate dehydrogenase